MKVPLCVWQDRKGIISFELLRRGETITSDKYCEQLTRLARAIREKRPILAYRKGVIFHHNNARPHVAQQTLRKLQELQWGNSAAPTIFSRYCAFRFLSVPVFAEQFKWQESQFRGSCRKPPHKLFSRKTKFFLQKWNRQAYRSLENHCKKERRLYL